ncbi:metal ABC transporter substrate-binding protein [Symbioplanes lichenis]|uniref:metal ABC transporter substrate-binding protein n=1 Tax=Symbioplanes lichenis TaxID=1629072 RepID=UPI0027392F0F|nr:metal ABC transporter substrate-binding protein [Actinoplanes lichenis]
MPPVLSKLAVAAVLLLGGCAAPAGAGDKGMNVVTAFYPLQYLAQRIGGGDVNVTDLTKPGAEPHDLELSPRQVGRIVDARLVVYLDGFQPAVDQAVAQEAQGRAFDVGTAVTLLPAEEHEHEPGEEEHAEAGEGADPHVWLDPERYATIAGALAGQLAQKDPAHATVYEQRAAQIGTELKALDAEYQATLSTCERREIVTSHAAFHYLADRYGLTEVGITGISPEAEPSPQRLAHVAEEARATGTTTIFFETLVSPKVADTIAKEVGARTAVLDPLESAGDGEDYFTIMRANLAALTTALGCAA